MKYNIAKNSLVTTNTTLGNTSLTSSGIEALLNYSETPIVTLRSINSGILVIECDLGKRVDVYQVNYNFRSNKAISSTASGIKFYYKNEPFDNYSVVPMLYDGTEHYYTLGSGSPFAPRYIRVSTTMTSISGGTTVTGTVHGFEVLNNDSIVNFGTDGNQASKNFFIYKDGDININTVPIYNSGNFLADAVVSIEPVFSEIDQVLSISDSNNGPWISTFDENLVITNTDTLEYGQFNNTNSTYGIIQLSSILDKDSDYVFSSVSGTYTTSIFTWNNYEQSMFIVDKSISSAGGKLIVDSTDAVDTAEIRYSNYKPVTYSIYRTLYSYYPGSGTTRYLAFKDYWKFNDTLKQTSVYYFFSFSYYRDLVNYFVVIDPNTERWAGFFYTYSTSGSSTAEWRIFNNLKESSSVTKLMSTHSTAGTSMSFVWYKIELDSNGGMWVYFYATAYHTTDIVDHTGYYLIYLDQTLTIRYINYLESAFVYDMSIDYSTGYIWYTDNSSDTIFKLSPNGTIVVNYSKMSFTDSLGGIVALDDGSAWYFDNGSLRKIKQLGSTLSVYFLDSIENFTDSNFSTLEKDGDGSEALWFISGSQVGRIFISGNNKGKIDFEVTVDSPLKLIPISDGCWIMSSYTTGSKMIFVSKISKKIANTITSNNMNMNGIIDYTHDNKNYANKMPITIDDNWKNLTWSKINTKSYILTESTYQQLRFTFRAQTPNERYTGLDGTTQFIATDYFTQSNGAPINTQLWGDWTKSLNIVNVQSNKLVLPSSTDAYASNAFINTKYRMLIGSNSSNIWDLRINFMFNTGTATGKIEQLFFYVVAFDAEHYGNYMYASYEPGYNTTAYMRIYQNTPTTSVSNSFSATYNTTLGWQGVLRLYKDSSNNISVQYDKAYDGTFEATTSLTNAQNFGTYFYVSVSSLKGGSNTYIDSFQMVSGNAYYYTETPGIKAIHTLKPLIINDIYPNTYKNLYIRSQIPTGLDVLSNYSTNLNVKWRMPVY